MAVDLARRKKLYGLMPEGVIANRKWLMDNGIGYHAVDNLVKSRQLELISKGVYVRNAEKISWQSLVYSLQSVFNTDLIVGGLTSFEIQGLSHYLSLSEKRIVHLFGNDPIPKWVSRIPLEVSFVKHAAYKLFKGTIEERADLHEGNNQLNSYEIEMGWNGDSAKLAVSTIERAYLEILSDVPDRVTFEHADQLMQGLTSLSPRKLQRLLEVCRNVKVKRLFFWFADRHNYIWLSKINRERIPLGSGNRSIVKGGKLDSKYRITVPEWL